MTLDEALVRLEHEASERWGNFCREVASDAQSRAPVSEFGGGGALRQSMTCEMRTDGARVEGTITFSAPYAVFVHEGTGQYHPQGRKTPWVYPVEQGGETRFFTTEGQPAEPFLRQAVEAARASLERNRT